MEQKQQNTTQKVKKKILAAKSESQTKRNIAGEPACEKPCSSFREGRETCGPAANFPPQAQ